MAQQKVREEAPPILDEKKLSEIYEYPSLSKYEGLRGQLDCRAHTTFVGVEIELEKVYLKHNVPSSWNSIADGSLKVEGREFTTVPIRFCYLEKELERLFACMTTPPDASSRCSVHVHLNVRDFTQQELFRFVLLYLIFEKGLFNFSGGRSSNIFCTPLYEYVPMVKLQLNKLRKVGGIKAMSWNKYFALNLVPIWGQVDESAKIGTIEFRHMAGTTNIEHIIEWINLIVSLKISAKKMDTEKLLSSLETMNTISSYNQLVQTVFKEWSIHFLTQKTFKEDVEHGVMIAKEVSFLLDKKTKFELEVPFPRSLVCAV